MPKEYTKYCINAKFFAECIRELPKFRGAFLGVPIVRNIGEYLGVYIEVPLFWETTV